ncbi:MAG: DJ-1/PfpI family protein [Candidatus Kapabacteria bacterium]|nr:DJ-1/PfpI family protein [Candidatus Kapabacteria bacterium]
MITTALITLADGSEELETVAVIDILRRAGVDLIVASDNNPVVCSRGTKIIADISISEIPLNKLFDIIILPGGMPGTSNLAANEHLTNLIRSHYAHNKIIAAICAAPTILLNLNLLDKILPVCSHPSVASQFKGYNYVEEKCAIQNNIITSRGAGTAVDFALKITETLCGSEISTKIAKDIAWG